MSALDKGSGVRDVPTPRCLACHQPVIVLASGRRVHQASDSACRAAQ